MQNNFYFFFVFVSIVIDIIDKINDINYDIK